MTEESVRNENWAIPKFSFQVKINGIDAVFQEVSGLEIEPQRLEFTSNTSADFRFKLPGLKKSSNITLKKGVFPKDDAFMSWLNNVATNHNQLATVVIKLLDEKNNPTFIWTLENAWPTKITGKNTDTNHFEIETIELVYENIVMQ